MLDCWMDVGLDCSYPPSSPDPRMRQKENFWRSCRGGQWESGRRRTATACRTRFLKARWVWGRSSSPRQSGRFGALLRRSLLLHEFPLFAERIRGPLNGMHFPTFCPCLKDGVSDQDKLRAFSACHSLSFMTRCKASLEATSQ